MKERCKSWNVLLLTSVCMIKFAVSTSHERPTVHTSLGVVVGQRITVGGRDVDEFLGIPYAEPPLGELRFRKPQPVRAWNGTFNAVTKPLACRQFEIEYPFFGENFTRDHTVNSEDCLHLNIWRPATTPGQCSGKPTCDAILPVVVYIHGGGFQAGDATTFLFDASNYVALENVVFVTFQYRLSYLGYLTSETPDLPGNLGLWDQNLLLKWVRDNIGYFGGNPKEVTLVGQSAGGISAVFHSISSHSSGLFKRIILQSGSPFNMNLFGNRRALFIQVARATECYDEQKDEKTQVPDIVACLRNLDAEILHSKVMTIDYKNQPFFPVDDNDFFMNDPFSLETYKKLNVTEILTGSVLSEGSLFLYNLLENKPQVRNGLHIDYRVAAALVVSAVFDLPLTTSRQMAKVYLGDYDVEYDTDTVLKKFARMVGDSLFDCPTNVLADMAASQGIPTYKYSFAHKPSFDFWPDWMGVTHATDLPFTMGSLPFITDLSKSGEHFTEEARKLLANVTYTEEEKEFMKQVVGAWSAFAKKGSVLYFYYAVDIVCAFVCRSIAYKNA
ncbi:acetylcholinesterase-like [Ixodes scapularis]|uniref:acetylcholinesterase-like n=1 Tax=Ixodes scapularis TaxID=6945 RepID=UPI001A9F7B99|nr:acetylcholinesterase-like [Ixodes scapularis]